MDFNRQLFRCSYLDVVLHANSENHNLSLEKKFIKKLQPFKHWTFLTFIANGIRLFVNSQ